MALASSWCLMDIPDSHTKSDHIISGPYFAMYYPMHSSSRSPIRIWQNSAFRHSQGHRVCVGKLSVRYVRTSGGSPSASTLDANGGRSRRPGAMNECLGDAPALHR